MARKAAWGARDTVRIAATAMERELHKTRREAGVPAPVRSERDGAIAMEGVAEGLEIALSILRDALTAMDEGPVA